MTLISIDPAWAKPMAYAIFENGKVIFYDKIFKFNDIKPDLADMLVTEDPYPAGSIKKYSYKGWVETFKKLCFAVGRIIEFAEINHVEYKLIRPVDWKRYWSLTKRTSETLQQRIRTEITEVEGSEDIQDAILIGKYYIEHVMEVEGAHEK